MVMRPGFWALMCAINAVCIAHNFIVEDRSGLPLLLDGVLFLVSIYPPIKWAFDRVARFL